MTVKSIKIINNKIIKNPKGDIIKFLNRKSKLFSRFGEVYFSEIKKNKTKGWNIHFKSKCIVSHQALIIHCLISKFYHIIS